MSENEQGQSQIPEARMAGLRRLTHIIYGLQAASFFMGVTFIIAVVTNYIKIDDVRGTWLESHFKWQMRTFWFGLLWLGLGILLSLVVIGAFVLVFVAIWIIYRIIKGWIYLNEGRPIGVPPVSE